MLKHIPEETCKHELGVLEDAPFTAFLAAQAAALYCPSTDPLPLHTVSPCPSVTSGVVHLWTMLASIFPQPNPKHHLETPQKPPPSQLSPFLPQTFPSTPYVRTTSSHHIPHPGHQSSKAHQVRVSEPLCRSTTKTTCSQLKRPLTKGHESKLEPDEDVDDDVYRPTDTVT